VDSSFWTALGCNCEEEMDWRKGTVVTGEGARRKGEEGKEGLG
jgi:hypothetical protein